MRNNLPFNVMRDRNSWDNVPRDPMTVGLFLTAGSASAFVTYAVGFIATTLITSAVMRALAPKPPSMQEGLLTNVRQPAAAWDIVYGETRKGGTITYLESTGDENKYLHMIVTLAGHEVAELGDVYINDGVVTIDANHYVTSDPWVKSGDSEFVYVRKFTGASNQDIYSTLSGITDGPTFENEAASNTASNFKGQGVACLYVRMKYDREIFASGIPNVTCVVKGKKVYDPRTDTTAYSDNAALCIRDYLTSEYGLNTPAATIDDTYFSTAANDCDTNSGSGAENKFKIGGVVKTDRNIKSNLQDMVGACVGNLYYSAGKFKLIAGVYSAPVKDLTLDDLRSELSVETRSSRRDNFNSVQGTFIWSGVDDGSGSNGDWTQTDYPPITSSTFVTEDNGYENPLQLDLPLTTNSTTAQRIAKQTLFRAREQMFVTAEFGMNAFDLEVGDTVTLTVDRYGFSSKEFEVISWAFSADQDGGDLRVSLGLKETSAAAYAWDGEEEDIISNNSNLPLPNEGLTITNLTASGGGRTQGDGTFINSVILDWDDVTNSYLDYYDIEWKAVSDTAYSATTSNVSTIEISPLVDGIQYTLRVRAVNMSGFRGPWTEVQFTGGGDETAPALPTAISATGHFKYISINWTNPADADLNYIEVYENTTNSTTGAVKVGISAGDNFQRTNLGLSQVRWYFLKAVDYSGNSSGFTAGVSAQTTFLDDPDFENGIYTLFKDQGLYAIRDVTGLPPSGTFTGEKVFNRDDGKLYTWTGSAWEATVADVGAGSITETEIADNAISTPKLQANAVTASNILGGTITGNKISANTITGGLLATSGIITNSAQITDAVVTNAKIENLAVSTIKVADRAITSQTSVDVASWTTSVNAFITGMSVSVNASAGEEAIVGASFLLIKPQNNEREAEYRILWNGVIQRFGRVAGGGGEEPFTDIFGAITQSGTNTLEVQVRTTGNSGIENGTGFIFEAFK